MAQQKQQVVKVYILIGQSNMVGMADVGHLEQLAKSNDPMYSFLWNRTSNTFATTSDVRLMFNNVTAPSVDLQVGYGQFNRENFGPEIGFGWTMQQQKTGDLMLLIKCAEGGTHLGVEWRSPSQPIKDYSTPTKTFLPTSYGTMWSKMMSLINAVRNNFQKYVVGQTSFEISGILWLQGWNDAFNAGMRQDYEINLSIFVQDLMNEFGPTIPIFIGELGQFGTQNRSPAVYDPYGNVEIIRQAQIRVVNQYRRPNIVFVPTSPYAVFGATEYDGVHHYFGRADTMIKIGNAFARAAMVFLQTQQDPVLVTVRPTSLPPSVMMTPSPVPAPPSPEPQEERATSSPSSFILTIPTDPPCTRSGDKCSTDSNCCSSLCQLVPAFKQTRCTNLHPSKTDVKYGSTRGGFGSRDG